MTWCGCPDAPRVMHAPHVMQEALGWRVVSYVPVGSGRYEHLPWTLLYRTKVEAERWLAMLVLRLDT